MSVDIRSVISTIRQNKNRPKDRKGKPGGLIELTTKVSPIIVGDLHSCQENLEKIIAHNDNEKKLKSGQSVLILLGDTVHNDQMGMLREMESSLRILEYVFELLRKYGNSVLYLRGNHDCFDENLVKSSIRQGLEFRNYVREHRGEKYVQSVEAFFESLPVFIIANKFVITHAGPVRGGTDREELINIYSDPDKYLQLMWNRINEFRGTPSSKEYDEYDIRKTLEKLALPPKTHFIVGHNPLWNTGNTSGVWLNVLGIENHHILYSGANTRAPYLTFEKDRLIVHYAISSNKEALYV